MQSISDGAVPDAFWNLDNLVPTASAAAGRLEHNSNLPADSSERVMVGDAIAKAKCMSRAHTAIEGQRWDDRSMAAPRV